LLPTSLIGHLIAVGWTVCGTESPCSEQSGRNILRTNHPGTKRPHTVMQVVYRK